MLFAELIYHVRFSTLADVKAYVEANPEAIKTKDMGRLLLHDAVDDYKSEDDTHSDLVSFEKVKFLVEAYPQALYEKDDTGKMPLFIASASRVISTTTYKYLLSSGKIAASSLDNKNSFPLLYAMTYKHFEKAKALLEIMGEDAWKSEESILHKAILLGAPIAFIRSVLSHYPSCINAKDEVGRTPLHSVVMTDQNTDYDIVRLLVQYGRARLCDKDNQGFLPIHLAAYTGATTAILELLYKEYPQGILAVGNPEVDKSILHLAISNKTRPAESKRVIAWILDKCPILIRVSSSHESFPIHTLAERHYLHPIETLQKLTRLFPRALQIQNCYGNVPLHCALQDNAPVSIDKITFLLDECPGVVSVKTKEGKLPLHVACAAPNQSKEVIELLCVFNPGALIVFDKLGLLPFHHCCQSATNRQLMEHMITKLDNGATLPTTKSGKPAVFVAAEANANLDVLYCLVQRSPELFEGPSHGGTAMET